MRAVKKFSVKSCSLCGMKRLRKHKFPIDPERRKQWIKFAVRHGLKPNANSLLCELHFDRVKDYNTSRLKVTAVPTIFKPKFPTTKKIKMMTLRSQYSKPKCSATSKKNNYSSVQNLQDHSNGKASLGTNKMLPTSSNALNDFEDSDSPEESETDIQNSVAQPITLPTSSNALNDFEDSDSPEESETDIQNSVAQPITSRTLPTSSNVLNDFEDSDSPEESKINIQNSVAQPITLPTSSNALNDFEDSDSPEESETDIQNSVAQPITLPTSSNVSNVSHIPGPIKEEIVSLRAGGTDYHFKFPCSNLPKIYNININQPNSTSRFSFAVDYPSSQPTTSSTISTLPVLFDNNLDSTIKEEPEDDDSSVTCEMDADNSTLQPITEENMTNDIDQNLDPHNIEVDGFSQQPNNSLTQTSVFNDVIQDNIHDKNEIEADVVDGDDTLQSSNGVTNDNMQEPENSNAMAIALVKRKKFVKCKVCKRSFFGRLKLRAHMRIWARNLKMAKAHKKSNERKNTRSDVSFSTTAYITHCQICDVIFVGSVNAIMKHKRRHIFLKNQAKKDQHKCDICNEVVSSSLILEDHMKSHEMENTKAGEEQYKCDICNDVVSSSLILEDHMKGHEMENIQAMEEQYKCDICNEVVSSSLILEDHMKNHEMENIQAMEEQYKCDICNEVVSSSLILEDHMKSHEMENIQAREEQYKCDICNEVVSSSFILEKHMESHKMEINQAMEEKYKCDICNEMVSSSLILEDHKKSHKMTADHATMNNPLQCNICSKIMRSSSILKLHLRTHAKIIKKCDICDEKFVNKLALLQHIKKCHVNVESSKTTHGHEINNLSTMFYKKFCSSIESLECKICKLSFKTPADLKLHIQNHLDCTVKYHCNICNCKYTNIEAFLQHKKSHTHGPTTSDE